MIEWQGILLNPTYIAYVEFKIDEAVIVLHCREHPIYITCTAGEFETLKKMLTKPTEGV